MSPSYASLCSVSNVFFSGNVTNFPAVLQPSSTCQWFRLLTVCCQCFTHQPIVFCIVRPTHNSLGLTMRAVSPFYSWAAALVSRPLTQACTPLTKSEEKERLLTVYYIQQQINWMFRKNLRQVSRNYRNVADLTSGIPRWS